MLAPPQSRTSSLSVALRGVPASATVLVIYPPRLPLVGSPVKYKNCLRESGLISGLAESTQR